MPVSETVASVHKVNANKDITLEHEVQYSYIMPFMLFHHSYGLADLYITEFLVKIVTSSDILHVF